MFVNPSPTRIAALSTFWNIGGPILLIILKAFCAFLDDVTQSRIFGLMVLTLRVRQLLD